MKLFACYSPSHLPLVEQHFRPSIPAALELTERELPQESETGEFLSPGFGRTMMRKVAFLLELLGSQVGDQPFIFSDVDVRFYGDPSEDLLALLGDADILFQDDGPAGACTGFMCMRPSPRVMSFWHLVADAMPLCGFLDQDATNQVLETAPAISWDLLPERYWTFGQVGHEWKMGEAVSPPRDLLVHHANWTRGVPRKLALLQAVSNAHRSIPTTALAVAAPTRGILNTERIRQAVQNIELDRSAAPKAQDAPDEPGALFERHPFEASHARRLMEEQGRQCESAKRQPDRIAIILGFWRGDRARALDLARLLADIEPERRDDVLLVLARQKILPTDEEIARTIAYCGNKFATIEIETEVDEQKPYPGIAFDPWASAMAWFSEAYYSGHIFCPNAFFIEADGCPLRGWREQDGSWIDDLKAAHQETLSLGKRVTGPMMTFGGHRHINGTMAVHASLWPDRPSLHRSSSTIAWDVFHGPVLVSEAGPSHIIRNEWGATDLTAPMFLSMGMESCWLTSMKDRSAFGHAESLLIYRGPR